MEAPMNAAPSTPFVQEPPWVEPRTFDVKKKPPIVPRPRPRRDVAREEVPTAATSVVCERPRWGQLDDDRGSHAGGAGVLVSGFTPSSVPELGDLSTEKQAAEASPVRTTSEDSVPTKTAPANVPQQQQQQQQLDSSSHPSDYTQSWQRWRAMPTPFHDKMQDLVRPTPPPPEKCQAPSPEALDFFEQLLAGTEAAELEKLHQKVVPATLPSAMSVKVANASQRLKAQARAVQRQRQSSVSVGAPRPAYRTAHCGGNDRVAADSGADNVRPARSSSPSRAAPQPPLAQSDEEACQRRMRERQEEHSRRLRKLEEEAAREEQKLRQEIERASEEREARRAADEAWREELRKRIERSKMEAERKAAAQEHQQQQSAAEWQARWWKDYQKMQERAQQKTEEHSRWKAEWWEHWKEEEEEEQEQQQEHAEQATQGRKHRTACDAEFSSGSSARTAPASPPRGEPPRPLPPQPPPRPPAAARTENPACLQVFGQLCEKRGQRLEERKQAWRRLCLQWHPDKCGDKDKATAMFQYLQGLKDWFLAKT
mmetsp:Transcript_4933/g.14834  ORF Transcript_4933/g.14834 Transcript_4933/m.14834 type:complete len:541 (-) Transcript_4933:29-1651(-)